MDVTEREIKETFSKYGDISDIRIVRDKNSGKVHIVL